MKSVEIAGRAIGEGQPPFVMLEVGINHEGSFEKAIQCVDAAKASGADAVKFHCHIAEHEMVPTEMTPGNVSDEKLWDIIVRCSLTHEEEIAIQAHCKKKGILFLSTPFSREAADRLQGMKVPAFKIGSGECNNYPLVEHIASFRKPIILSTGMNNLESVAEAVRIIQSKNAPLILTHCTSMYPTPYDQVRLGAISQLREAFQVPVGLSCHSRGIYTCLGAVALGANLLEKHFAVSLDWPGPDIKVSINPAEATELVRGARAIWEARGGSKTILPGEQPVIGFAYASVVTLQPVKAGQSFSRENTWVKRPGDGRIHARELQRVLGKKAKKNIPANAQLKPEDIEGF